MQSVLGGFLALALIAAPNAKQADCTAADNRYTSAVVKVAEALRAFENCVASSRKRNACTAEFEALDEAHDDFADAVDDLKNCPERTRP